MRVRDARPEDNAALVALATLGAMAGDLSLCVDRRPDFFALNRIAGDAWRVGVVDGDDGPIACVAVARRPSFLDGRPDLLGYVGDLKVHPAYRRRGVARVLAQWARTTARELVGPNAPLIATVLTGNNAVEMLRQRVEPGIRRQATIRSHSIDLLTRRRIPPTDLTVAAADHADEPDMVELWRRVAASRQFAPVCESFPLTRPGLEYLVARRPGGELAGFVGLWDQHDIKQMRVTGYSPRLAAARVAFNVAAPLFGVPRLPRTGGELSYRTVVNPCASDPATLRTLVRHACNRLHGRHSFLTIGLDVRDPLTRALSGLRAQRTDVDLLALGAPPDRAAPVHFEIATV
ncbi:GNAT family N-acetyltransferase [Catellatospora tritici]|uniref:GNAT family N-acetyltransferase n=1 Tax=Catellatospora tritici TaxID=2851566 RepID=UPI001C2D6A31|nr:GNAT family N-acetyltransferase [Catellatospora tritici]MBV1855904.1 GNAT family N-acetyltransferase [Catellatospora tritici]